MIREKRLCGKQPQKGLLYFCTSGLWLSWPNFSLHPWVSLTFSSTLPTSLQGFVDLYFFRQRHRQKFFFPSFTQQIKKRAKRNQERREGRGRKYHWAENAVYGSLIPGGLNPYPKLAGTAGEAIDPWSFSPYSRQPLFYTAISLLKMNPLNKPEPSIAQ